MISPRICVFLIKYMDTAVKITHYNIISAVFQFMSVMTASAAKFGPPPALPGNQLPTGLAYLPLYHSYGLFAFAFRLVTSSVKYSIL